MIISSALSLSLPLTMNAISLIPVLLLHLHVIMSVSVEGLEKKPRTSNKNSIAVLGSVYCDTCSSHNFSKHSYFLKGAKVLIECKFKANTSEVEEIFITAERTTDKFGVYKLDVPPVDGFQCRQGREIKSMCKATLLSSSSSHCNIAAAGSGGGGQSSSTSQHVAARSKDSNACFFNLNALSFRPAKGDALQCGAEAEAQAAPSRNSVPAMWTEASLFFWPMLPPVALPWPLSSLPFPWNDLLPWLLPPSGLFPFPRIPLPDPSSLPFTIPSWILSFLKPPFFPFPFPLSPFADPPSPPLP